MYKPRLFPLLLILSLSGVTIPQIAVSQNIDQLYQQGNELRNTGKYAEAEAIWRKAIQLNPNDANAYVNLGTALSDQGKLNEAIAAYEKAIQLNPNDAAPYSGLGNRLSDQGKFDEAIAAYEKAIQLNPNYAEAYNNLGVALKAQGKFDEAIAAYEKAIQLNPNYAEAYNNLGVALKAQGKINEAIAAYEKAIKLNPNYASPYVGLGIALKDQGKLNEAIAALQKALNLPDSKSTPASAHAAAYNALGYTLYKQGKLEEAIAQYKKAIALDPNFAAPRTNLEEAERQLALRGNPTSPTVTEIIPTVEKQPLIPVLRSVVQVIVTLPAGSQKGTGWVIKREGNTAWILTCRHVVTDEEKTKRPSETITIEVEFYSEPLPKQVRLRKPAKIIHITNNNDDSLDLAILEIKDIPKDIQPLTIVANSASIDQDIRIIGHPFNGKPWSLARGYISVKTSSNLQLGGDLAEGDSGAPVLDEHLKQVVGIVFEIPNNKNKATTGGFGSAYPMEIINQQLQNWGFKF